MLGMLKTGPDLIAEIDRTRAENPTLWWLGNCGFAIKYYDIIFYVDPLLSSPAPVTPAMVHHADLILCTHADDQHMDPATLPPMLAASARAKVVLPKSTAEHLNQRGVPFHRMTTTDSDLRIEYFKMGIYARVYAVPSAHPDLAWTALGGYPYLGYLIRCGDTTIYHAGDCVPYEGLADRLRPYNVKVALMPVGGREENGFTPEEAAQLASDIGAEWLAPMHHGSPSGKTMERFVDHMLFHRPEQRFKVFEPAEGWEIPPASASHPPSD